MISMCFVTAGDATWASSRMRAYWPAEVLGAEVVTWNEVVKSGEIPDVAVYVFQKFTTPEMVAHLTGIGRRVYWDVCDPSWWFEPKAAREIADEVTGIVASNHDLAEDCDKWINGSSGNRFIHVIPDCIKPEHFTVQREHVDTSPVRLIWFGLSPNRIALHAAAANLQRLRANGYKIELTICDNEPDRRMPELEAACPTYYRRWSLDSENETIAAHDIALLPPYPGPWGKVKSNNKSLTAGMCGLPVTTGECYQGLAGLVANVNDRRELGQRAMSYSMSFTIDRAAAAWRKVAGE